MDHGCRTGHHKYMRNQISAQLDLTTLNPSKNKFWQTKILDPNFVLDEVRLTLPSVHFQIQPSSVGPVGSR